MKSTPKRAGQIRTSTRVAEPPNGPLTAEEERVVRMIHGLSEEDDHELAFVSASDPEVNTRLQLMEAILLAEMHGGGPMAGQRDLTPKEKILSHLKRLKDE
ncbi:MAG: hypothetical protein JW797_12400 [Bradymonadales bacterium]|nr:hypothetical protein [Bradymonadales bacterium]